MNLGSVCLKYAWITKIKQCSPWTPFLKDAIINYYALFDLTVQWQNLNPYIKFIFT